MFLNTAIWHSNPTRSHWCKHLIRVLYRRCFRPYGSQSDAQEGADTDSVQAKGQSTSERGRRSAAARNDRRSPTVYLASTTNFTTSPLHRPPGAARGPPHEEPAETGQGLWASSGTHRRHRLQLLQAEVGSMSHTGTAVCATEQRTAARHCETRSHLPGLVIYKNCPDYLLLIGEGDQAWTNKTSKSVAINSRFFALKKWKILKWLQMTPKHAFWSFIHCSGLHATWLYCRG